MAQGTVTMFEEALGHIGLGSVYNLNTDTFKIGLIKVATTPTAADADPAWGAGGTTNFTTNQSTVGGNYANGGADITNTFSEAGGVGRFDAADQAPYLASHGSNPTDVRWGIIYSDTATNKNCLGFIDMGATFDATTGDINITWNGSGIFTFTIT